MSAPYTVAWSQCLACSAAYAFAFWPWNPAYGEETVTHGLCDSCAPEFEKQWRDAA